MKPKLTTVLKNVNVKTKTEFEKTLLSHNISSQIYHQIILFCFSLAIGDGWSPAYLRSERDLDFIKVARKYVSPPWSYRIGGSSCSEQVSLFHYCTCDSAGKINYFL